MFSSFCSDLFKYLLGAPWTLLKSFSHRVHYLYFMFVHIVFHAHNTERFCTVICNFIIFLVFIVKFYVQKRDFNKHMYSVFLK